LIQEIPAKRRKMEVEENLQLIRARYDAVNAHDLDAFQGFYADSIVWSDPGLPTPITGARSVRERLEELTTAFPDLHWELDKIFGQGENVCAEFTFTGTHRGVLPDNRDEKSFPATNKPVRIQAGGVYVVREGKIVNSRIYFDFGSLISQIQKDYNDA
jgi:steroid delta-isomerase-like uncharacterized protein